MHANYEVQKNDGLADRLGQMGSRFDLNQARLFLTALDENTDGWCFQTFSDRGGQDKRLVRQFHGSLDQHADDLAELNERGAGVFFTVNETNGRGRKKADIRRIRALHIDLDGAPLGPLQSAPAPQGFCTYLT